MNKSDGGLILLEYDKDNFECGMNFQETVEERFLVEAGMDYSCR